MVYDYEPKQNELRIWLISRIYGPVHRPYKKPEVVAFRKLVLEKGEARNQSAEAKGKRILSLVKKTVGGKFRVLQDL